ncbi:MAG: hypothetical protein KAJ51_01535 [Thermoplasmata archaeon]|nr:hypothetical protein [Thermoplasmata archaeon]
MATSKVQDLPSAIYVNCPKCNDETIHTILKGKLSKKRRKETLDCTVKCTKCKSVHQTLIQTPKTISVPIIISKMGESTQNNIELNSNDALEVGDEIILDNNNLMITSLETHENKRVTKTEIPNLRTIWAKLYDKVRVKISVNKGGVTFTHDIWAVPDEEFFIGDILNLGKLKTVIHRIKTNDKLLKSEGAMATARDIVRLYGSAIR